MFFFINYLYVLWWLTNTKMYIYEYTVENEKS